MYLCNMKTNQTKKIMGRVGRLTRLGGGRVGRLTRVNEEVNKKKNGSKSTH